MLHPSLPTNIPKLLASETTTNDLWSMLIRSFTFKLLPSSCLIESPQHPFRTRTPSQLSASPLKDRIMAYQVPSTGLRPAASHHQPYTQIYSLLLSSLPLEIRHQIYLHVLHAYRIVQHIDLSNDKLTHMRCASPASHILFQFPKPRDCLPYHTTYCEDTQIGWEILALLLSCKQMWAHSIHNTSTAAVTLGSLC